MSGLAKNVLKLNEKVDIQAQGHQQQNQSNDGKGADAAADGTQVFYQLLLLEGIAVGGFADAVQLIFNALERGALLGDLSPELAMAGADFGEAALDWLQIDMDLLDRGWDRGRWRGVVMARLRSYESADGGGEVAVEQGKQPLHQRNGGADGVHGALQA